MTPIDLREFVEQLRVSDTGSIAEFALEILDLVDHEERTRDFDEIVGTVKRLAPKRLQGKEIWRQLEYIEDRLDILSTIETHIAENRERFAMAGIETDKRDGADDVVAKLVDGLPWEWDL